MANPPCPPEDWPRFSALLDQGLALTDAELQRWFATLAADDAPLRPWLANVLLGADNAETAGFLRQPPLASEDFATGDIVGPYVLIARLGEGGMGEVWRATRAEDGPKRDVALKLPHAAFLGTAFRRRFAVERDVLAALSHPHIGQLYEAGSSGAGHPYLALELVEGAPITSYCRTHAATLAQRVDLVRQVLAGLSYAHQRLIVHRDIKPSNALVTPEGQVKLLDFGIAKLLGPDTGADAALTHIGNPATPAYAAPEQLAGGAITVATDIYAVGVLLFELCTGTRPFGQGPAPRQGAQEAPLASARADAHAAGMAEKHKLPGLLRGDLDAVIARALSSDPAGRYPSATAFDDDLGRWRAGLPVRARRIGWMTRTQKYARRNRLGVALGGVLALSLLGGTAGIAWQARRAEAEAVRATAIKNFIIALFTAGDPHGGAKRAEDMTARDLLDRGADRAEAAFGNDLAAKIELLGTLGDIYDLTDDGTRAIHIRSRRLALTRQLKGDADPDVIRQAMDLAGTESQTLDYASALAVLAGIEQPILQRFGRHSLPWAQWLTQHAQAIRSAHGTHDAIVAETSEAVAIFAASRLAAGDTTSTGDYVTSLEQLETEQEVAQQYEAALASLRHMSDVLGRYLPNDPVERLIYLYRSATVLEHQGKLDEADAAYASLTRQAEPVMGRDSQLFQFASIHRAWLAALRGNMAGAQTMFDQTGDFAKQGRGRQIYGAFLVATGRGAEAVAPLQTALAMTRQRPMDEDAERQIEATLGVALAQAGRVAEAREMLRAARDAYLRWGVPGTAATLGAEERWGHFLLDQGDTAQAAAAFSAVLAQSHGAPSAPAALAASGLASVALEAGHIAEADERSAASLRLLNATTVEHDVRARIDVWVVRAEVLQALGRTGEARDLAARAATAADTEDARGTAQPARAHALITRLTGLR